MQDAYTVTTRAMPQVLATLIEAGLVPFITSSPGMGKSSIVAQLAQAGNLKLIDHRLSTSEPTDFTGLPGFIDGYAVMHPFREIFPLADQELPAGCNGWLLFLDEFPSASKAVQAAAYKLILDRMVGQHHLHPKVYIVAAGNKTTDRAIVNTLSTAMQSRLIHLEMTVLFNEWFEDVALAKDFHPTIKAFLMANPSKLWDFRPDHQDKTFCCPRTWEFMNKSVSQTDGPKEYMLPAYSGTITSGVATEFFQFCKVFDSLVTEKEILAHPTDCRVPGDASTKWAMICSMMDWVTEEKFEHFATYADRFSQDFKVLFYRASVSKLPVLRRHPKFTAASVQLGQLF